MQAKHLLKFNNYIVTPTLPRTNRKRWRFHKWKFPTFTSLLFWKNLRGQKKQYYYLILGSVLLLAGIAALTIALNMKKAEAAWYNDNWEYRQAITVTVPSNGSDVNNLETLLTIINTNTLISAGKLQTNCQDLRFTSQTGTLLPYYIDSGCNTASAKIWVAVDKVPANTTTYTLYMYYGNPSAIAGTNPTRFDLFNGLVGYWPMNETTWNNVAGEVKDVSVSGNNGQGSGYSSTSLPAGKYGNAGTFSGSQGVTLSPLSALTTNFTVSAWVKTTTSGVWQSIYRSGTATNFWKFVIDYNNHLDFTEQGITDYPTTQTISQNQWVFVAVTKNGDTGTNLAFYINGIAAGTASVGSVVTPSGSANIGGIENFVG